MNNVLSTLKYVQSAQKVQKRIKLSRGIERAIDKGGDEILLHYLNSKVEIKEKS